MVITITKKSDFSKQHEFLVGTRFGVRNIEFTDSDISQMDLSNVYLNIDRIIHENELEDLESFMERFKDCLGFYYSDMAVFTIAEKLDIVEKLIYNPGTLVTSVMDAEFYLGLGIKRVCLSKEITLEEILEFSHLGNKVEIIAHGKLNMFYSKRKLLTNYFDFLKQDVVKVGVLEEEIRDEHYPIIEDDHGTNIFHEKSVNSFKEFDKIKQFTLRVDGYLLDQFDYVIELYERLYNGDNADTVYNEYTSKYDDVNSGYYYKETLYKK